MLVIVKSFLCSCLKRVELKIPGLQEVEKSEVKVFKEANRIQIFRHSSNGGELPSKSYL